MDKVPNCVSGDPFYTKYTRKLFEGFARLVFRYYCPLDVAGRNNLPEGSFIFCSNHASHMDSIALMAASSRSFDQFGLLAASDYFFRNPWIYRCFSSIVNLIPISRTAGAESWQHTIALCRRFVEGGERHLIVFPEGTRSGSGKIGPFKGGVGLLSAELGLPIVPAYVHGSGDAMPKGRFFPAHKQVAVRIGVPIYPNSNGDNPGVRRNDWMVTQARIRIDEMRAGVEQREGEQVDGI